MIVKPERSWLANALYPDTVFIFYKFRSALVSPTESRRGKELINIYR